MSEVPLWMALFLLVNVLVSLGRALRGPTVADRMLTANLFGTQGVAMLLLLAEATGEPALRDVALVFVVLAVVAVSTFVTRSWTQRGRGGAA